MLSLVKVRAQRLGFEHAANELNSDRVGLNDFHTCKASFGSCVVKGVGG